MVAVPKGGALRDGRNEGVIQYEAVNQRNAFLHRYNALVYWVSRLFPISFDDFREGVSIRRITMLLLATKLNRTQISWAAKERRKI